MDFCGLKRYSIVSLLFLLCFCNAAVAQKQPEFTVVSFEEKPFDTSARDERYKVVDGNGELFSIIKLVSYNAGDDLRAYSFDFGYCESRVKQVDGEVWLYVQRNAMRATIRRAGYKTLKYELSVTVQPGKVYEMVLSAEALPVYRQMLQFNIKPSDVKSTIMYRPNKPGAQFELFGITGDDGSYAKSLELGTYVYEVLSENYHKSEGFIELTENKGLHVENVVLRPRFSKVTLQADEGADIYLNGEKVGTGSWSGILNADVYSVECRKDKHKSVSETITIVENKEQTIRLKSPAPIMGTLTVVSSPLNALITIDGKEYGVTPGSIDLLIGTHTVTLTRENYKSETFTVDVKENDVVEKEVKLNNIALMTISSTPAGSTLYVNGENVGATPYSASMASGDYDLRITRRGYRDFSKRVHLDSSNPNVLYTLKRQFQNKSCGYLEAAGQVGFLMGAGANAGCYIHNFNIEAYGIYGLTNSTVYINYPNGRDPDSDQVTAYALGARLGYGIIIGSRLRVTPQFGFGLLNVVGKQVSSSAMTLSLGARCEYALAKYVGVSATPEYSFAVSKKPVFEKLSAASSTVKGWGNGFNVRLGVYLYF